MASVIETTFIRLEKAAEMLGADSDTLLIAAGEGRICLYGLVNRAFSAYKVFDDPEEPFFDGEPERKWFSMAPIDRASSYELLMGETGEVTLLTELQNGEKWLGAADDDDDSPEDWRHVSRLKVFIKRVDVESILNRGKTPEAGTIADSPTQLDREYVSDFLSRVNQAARHWWAKADRSDVSTHPNNSNVASWLIERGLSRSLAKHAATIIRPKWAGRGRPPDEE